MIVVGVDPDSVRHGVAVYREGQLTTLTMMNEIEIGLWLDTLPGEEFFFSIENVLANNFVYTRNAKSSKAAHAKVALSVGRCQQSQEVLMRLLDHKGIPYQVIKPTGHNWAKNKALFEANTGWIGKSNEDSRSAAYFGWLGVKGLKVK